MGTNPSALEDESIFPSVKLILFLSPEEVKSFDLNSLHFMRQLLHTGYHVLYYLVLEVIIFFNLCSLISLIAWANITIT